MQRNRTFDGCDPKVPPLPLHRLPHALPITAGSSAMANVTVRWNPCAPVMRTRNPPLNGVCGDPRFMRAARMPTARDYGRLDALTTITGDAFDVEDHERHTA